MKKVLWIEDDAHFDLTQLTAPLYTTFRYHLDIATNVSKALEYIRKTRQPYDAIIVDIRLIPGESDQRWIKLYESDAGQNTGQTRLENQLGIQLLYSLLRHDSARIQLDNIPAWLTADKIAVFTVEEPKSMESHLNQLNITHYKQKTASIPTDSLLRLVEDVIASQKQADHNES